MARIITNVRTGFSTSLELMRSIWRGRFWWLVPVLAILLPAAVLFVFLQAVPLVAPFVYTVF